MNSKEFKEAMKNPKNIYCLVSTDSEMVDLYVNRFKSAIQADLISHGQIKPYGKLFRKKTLNVLYMPKIDPEIFDRNEYIFIYTDSIDKRSAAYKQHKDQFIELQNNYVPYIMEHSNLNEQQAIRFAKANKNDLGRIKRGLTVYKDSDFCYNRFTDYSSDIYAWVDSFIKGEKLPKVDESPISVMALLSTNCSNLLKVKQNDIVGMNPYIVQCMSVLSPYITEEQLVQIIGDCFYLDCQVKKGLMDIDYTLDYLRARRYGNGTSN